MTSPEPPLLAAGLTLALLGGAGAAALSPEKPPRQYAFRSWGTQDGLPQGSVQTIAQTPDGYLWFGTRAGLVRFDGVRFTVFDRGNTPAMASHQVEDLAVAADGTLWIAIDGGGLMRRDGDGRFRTWARGDGLPTNRVMVVTAGREGEVWFGTYGAGVGRFKDGEISFLTAADGLTDTSIWGLTVDRAGTLWIGTYVGGLNRYRDGVVTAWTIADGLPSNGVGKIVEDRRGDLWLGTTHGLARIRGGEIDTLAALDLPRDFIWGLEEDRDGNLWFGTVGGGLYRLTADGEVSRFHSGDGLPSDVVNDVFEDREGHLWIGTLGGGLSRLHDGPFVTYGAADGLVSKSVTSIYGDPEGTLWIGTFQGGLHRSRDDAQGFVSVFPGADDLAAALIFAVLGDAAGNLWIGTNGAGLGRLRDGRFTTLTTADGLANDVVLSLLEGRDGSLWIGTNGGVSRLRDGRFENLTSADGLASDIVRSLWESADRTLWIGSSRGLDRYRDGVLTHYGVEDGLSSDMVWAIHEDAAGTLWLGTAAGLDRFRDGEVVSFTTAQGLRDDRVLSILEDDRGYLWLATARGALRLRREELDLYAAGRRGQVSSIAFGSEDGLRGGECFGGHQPAAWKAGDGRLWFPTPHGAAVVDPANLELSSNGPAALVEEVVVDGGEVAATAPATLAPGSRRIEIRFTSLTLRSSESLGFRYRLEGFDADWQVDASGLRKASYTNLPPGDYRFVVAARREAGSWSPEPAAFAFTLRPRFYETWAFYVLCAVIAAAVVAALPLWRLRRARRHEAVLEQRVATAVAQIKVLRGMIPICSSCKKIREDTGYWTQLELYMAEHSEAEFSHGLCPECAARLYAEYTAERSPPERPAAGRNPPSIPPFSKRGG